MKNQVFDWENCLFIPSVFTPNMDGVNDFWEIYNIEIYEPEIILTIYNRWGQVVYDIEGYIMKTFRMEIINQMVLHSK